MNSGFKLAGFEEHPVVLCPSEPMLSSWQVVSPGKTDATGTLLARYCGSDRLGAH